MGIVRRFSEMLLLAMIFVLGIAVCSSVKQTQRTAEGSCREELRQAESENSTGGPEQTEPGGDVENIRRVSAVYLGVENYGAEETNKENIDNFRYRFEIDGREEALEIDNGSKDPDGNFRYPIQNVLKEGYVYEIQISDGVVTEAAELPIKDSISFEPQVSGIPGVHTLKNFLATALEPVGTTLYVYGGGWDWQDESSGIQARTIGVSPDWVRFFNEQDEDYTYRDRDGKEENKDAFTSFYPYGGYNEYYYAGLDCSGYLGWVLYNTLNETSSGEGYVGGSTGFAKRLSDMGFGEWTQEMELPDGSRKTSIKPGDIISITGHVWISLGTCQDGSVVMIHSTPSHSRTGQPGGGVQIGAIGSTQDCQAFGLADYYMSEYYPEWYRRYAVSLKEPESYFAFEGELAGWFSWTVTGEGSVLTDPEGYQELSPEKVLAELFEE